MSAEPAPPSKSRSLLLPVVALLLLSALGYGGYLFMNKQALAKENTIRDELKAAGAMIDPKDREKFVYSVGMALPGTREKASRYMPQIGQLAHMGHLDLSATNVSDDDLAALRGAKSLQSLVLNDTPVGDTGVGHLVALPITTLNLRGTKLTPNGLDKLASLSGLQVLDISATEAVNDVASLAKLTELEWVVMSSCTVPDQAFDILSQLPKLGRLTIQSSQVDEAKLQAFHDKNPRVKIEREDVDRVAQ